MHAQKIASVIFYKSNEKMKHKKRNKSQPPVLCDWSESAGDQSVTDLSLHVSNINPYVVYNA